MHPFLVWLLCAGGGTPASAALSNFAGTRRVFNDIPKENIEQLLNLMISWQSEYDHKYPGRNIGFDTAVSWIEYSEWLGRVSARRLGLSEAAK